VCIPPGGGDETSIAVSFLLIGVNFCAHQNVLLFLFLFFFNPAPPRKLTILAKIEISMGRYRLLKWKTIKSRERRGKYVGR
jgi:hypothetical protein